MYNWNFDNLSGYDYYLWGRYLFDYNPYNLYYITAKAAMFNIESVPDFELEPMYYDFMLHMCDYLLKEQKNLEVWVEDWYTKHSTPANDDVQVPEQFMKLLERLDNENTGS